MGGGSQAVPDRCLRLSHGDLPLGTLSAACGRSPDRVRFISHQGQQILLIDLTNCSAEEVMQTAAEAQRIVTAQPSKSVLTLSDITGAQFSRDAVTRMKEVAVFDRAYVKRAALVGAESLPKVFYEALKAFSRREFPRFKTRAEAMDWLVREEV